MVHADSSAASPNRPPAWFPDPHDAKREILWDGDAWTTVSRPAPGVVEVASESVTLQAGDRRVPVGSMSATETGDGFITVARDSQEARQAGSPFDASQPPQPDALVPADCVWAFDAPPSGFRGKPHRGDVRQRMQALGQLRGRTMNEIETYVGAPMAYDSMSRTRIYGQHGMFGAWQITLRFDNYWVCVGISDEISV